MDEYKVKQLQRMLDHETSEIEVHYGAHLSHWYGDTNPLTIDAGGLNALIRHYRERDTDLDALPPSDNSAEQSMTLAKEIASEIEALRADAKDAWDAEGADRNETCADTLEWVLGRLAGEDPPRPWAHY